MKLYRIAHYGSIDGLRLADAPDPVPARGEILVRVRACSLNHRDLLVVRNAYGGTPRADLVPLSDGAGEVVGVGEGVTRFATGDRVAGCFFAAHPAGALTRAAAANSHRGGAIDGMLAELVVLGEDAAVAIPPHLSFAEASTLPCAALTAWNALTTFGHAAPGQVVLTQGTGGVSVFALQFARLMGLRAIATSSTPGKLERAAAVGASATIDTREIPDWPREVRRLTGDEGADLTVEVGGPGTFARSLEATRYGGRVAVIGLLASGGETVDPLPILRRHLTVAGIYVGSRADFVAMNAAIALHELRPVIDRVFPFGDAPAAFRHLATAGHVGKVVIAL